MDQDVRSMGVVKDVYDRPYSPEAAAALMTAVAPTRMRSTTQS